MNTASNYNSPSRAERQATATSLIMIISNVKRKRHLAQIFNFKSSILCFQACIF